MSDTLEACPHCGFKVKKEELKKPPLPSFTRCDKCGKDYYKKAKECPYCKAPNTQVPAPDDPAEKKKMTAGMVAAILIGALLLAGYLYDRNTSSTPVTTNNTASNCFSQWDGSCLEVEKAIKKTMNDPSSYEHIETRYNKNTDGTMTVGTKFRGKNAFGGIVVNTAIGKVRVSDCSLIGTIEFE
ncbi:MAG TPA: hypothetical protein PK514_07485 [Spirochaetota bacterium]|nr:hypothetical protein [Spirochaetota bacterium]